jgi:hypothetical protein
VNERFKKAPTEPVFGVPEQENAIAGLFDPLSTDAPKIKVKRKRAVTKRVPCTWCGNPNCRNTRIVTVEEEVEE